jgi:hypothetical protein
MFLNVEEEKEQSFSTRCTEPARCLVVYELSVVAPRNPVGIEKAPRIFSKFSGPIGEESPHPVDDDDNNVTDLTGAAAGQGTKQKRCKAQALPVCGVLWVCAVGPHLVWNFLRACAHGHWGAGWTRGGSAVLTGFRARVRPVQLLAVLGVDDASTSVLMQGLLASRMQGYSRCGDREHCCALLQSNPRTLSRSSVLMGPSQQLPTAIFLQYSRHCEMRRSNPRTLPRSSVLVGPSQRLLTGVFLPQSRHCVLRS